jgi:hypothetical protein
MSASQERLQSFFWWFHGKDLVGFFKEVEEQGAENVRIMARPGLDENGRPDLHLSVVPEGSENMFKDHHEYNVSHPCPPFCNDK